MAMHGSPMSARYRDRVLPSATASSATSRLARYFDQLSDVRGANPAISSDMGRRASVGNASPCTAEASFESLRQKMRQEKYSLIDAESKVCFQQGLKDGTVAADNGIDCRREDAKRQNKDIKALILQEKEVQSNLQQNLSEAVQEAQGAYDACLRELDQLQITQQDFAELTGDLTDTGSLLEDLANSAPSTHVQNPEEAKGMKVLMRIQSALQEEKKKKLTLEEEAHHLEEELRRQQKQSAARFQQRDQECRLVSGMEVLSKAEFDIGLPQITFDDARGVVILDGARGSSRAQIAEEALRTVEVEFDKDGKLIRAMPNPKLGLHNEATDAVQLDDLPRLLTSVWHRLCCSAEKPVGSRHSRGGA